MEPTKKKGKAAIIVTIVISILLIASTAVGIWYYEKTKTDSEKAKLEEQKGDLEKKIDELKKQKEETSDETADWKTYENDKYDYLTKYPVSWVYKEYTKQLVGFADQESNLAPEQSDGWSPISIRSYTASELQEAMNVATAEEFINQIKEELAGLKQTSVDVSGTEATQISGEKTGFVEGVYSIETIFEKDDITYMVSYWASEMKDSEVDIYNKMLSTFKFTK